LFLSVTSSILASRLSNLGLSLLERIVLAPLSCLIKEFIE
jgi:hypothetical protein